MKVNGFEECLLLSHQAEDLPIWQEIYRKAFPSMVAMVNHRQDGEHQRAGIDRSVLLANAKQVLIDEKVRTKDYGDIALEYLSNSTTGAEGWVCKPLRADYIAYAILPSGLCYLLPVQQLQNAWLVHGEEWKSQRRIIKAKNPGYETYSVCVSPGELFRAINGEWRIWFSPVQDHISQ